MGNLSLWRLVRRGGAIAALPSLVALGWLAPAPAIQYSDGTVGFSYPPRLTESYTTRNQVGDSSATYYLSFDFPAAAAEPLDRVVIQLREGYDPIFRYRLEATQAFANTPTGRLPLPLGDLSQDPEARTLTIAFDPPVEPGQSITLALRPSRNPRFGGVYLFGATAYPVGETVEPTFMGYARLSFYEPDLNRWP